MTQKESISIETLIKEYEKITPEYQSPDPQELTSWHKSHPAHLTNIKTVRPPQVSFLPKLAQKLQTEKKIQLKLKPETNSSAISINEQVLSPSKPQQKAFTNIELKKDCLNTEHKKGSELKSLENLITKLKEIPSKIISKASSPPQMKAYMPNNRIYKKNQSISPKNTYFNGFQQSENVRKVIGFSYHSSIHTNVFEDPGKKNKFSYKSTENTSGLTKANKFPSFSINTDQNKSVIYNVLSQKDSPKKPNTINF